MYITPQLVPNIIPGNHKGPGNKDNFRLKANEIKKFFSQPFLINPQNKSNLPITCIMKYSTLDNPSLPRNNKKGNTQNMFNSTPTQKNNNLCLLRLITKPIRENLIKPTIDKNFLLLNIKKIGVNHLPFI